MLGVAIALVALIASQTGAPPSGEAGPPSCADSFATFGQAAGHWEGTWSDDFGGGGPLSMDVTINADCTLEATIDGIFGQPGPVTVNATYRDGNSTVVEIAGDPVFGDSTITVTDAGALTLAGTGLHQGIESVAATGTVSATQISLDVTLTFTGGAKATETVELTRDVPDTPTPAPTGPTPIAWTRLWGDVDCNNLVNRFDSLELLRGEGGLDVNYQTEDCPRIGAAVPVSVPATPWGDIDCNGKVDPFDALKTLLHDVGLSVGQSAGCPEIGSPF